MIVKWAAALFFTVIMSVMAGMAAGTIVATAIDGPMRHHQSVSMIAASFAAMIASSLTGFLLGRKVKP